MFVDVVDVVEVAACMESRLLLEFLIYRFHDRSPSSSSSLSYPATSAVAASAEDPELAEDKGAGVFVTAAAAGVSEIHPSFRGVVAFGAWLPCCIATSASFRDL